MARIRTIKPEFWTDDAITECSLSARLLFIGMWNFADDRGNIERSAKQMKMKIFPADTIEVEPLIMELIEHNLVIEYSVNSKKYLHIRTFTEHQKINRPSENGHPYYDDSRRTHGGLTEDSLPEGKGREGNNKGKDLDPAAITESVSTDSKPDGDQRPAAAETGQQKRFRDCFKQREAEIRRLYPHADYEPEKETCIAHYREGPPTGTDPYPTILKWFNRIPKPGGGNGARNNRSTEKAGTKTKRGFYEANGPDADWLGTGAGDG